MAKVLVVDDEKLIVKGIRFSLEQDGFEVACAYDGEEALQMAKETEYDMVLLDVMLPKLNGFEVCQAIREFSEMPIIMLTAKGDDMDKILGLEYGADDYITKPFNILEVKARIKAILRRNSKKSRQEPQQTKKVIEAGDLTLDSDSRRVFIASREINLTAKEFDLLELLVCNPGKVYSREELLRFVWGNRAAAGGDVRTVMHFHPAIAPVKVGILPLSKKLNEGAEKVYAELSKYYNCEFDDRGNIGKRYRRQDEIGTPFCVTYDFDSETDGAVTVRDRDTMEQVRIPIAELKSYFEEKLSF